jgi:hypothetical protein
VAHDNRMTPLGAFLERTKLDELPQLINILKGEMSFVGPRPESVHFADLFTGQYAQVLDYTPGIFGPNQVAFRNECDMYPIDRDPDEYYRQVLFPQKAKQDLAYFRKANLFTDIYWIFKGLWVSLTGIVNWRKFMGLHLKIVLADILAIIAAWVISYFIRFSNFPFPYSYAYPYLLTGLWLIPCLMIPIMFVGGCYRHPVSYYSADDAVRLVISVSFGWFLAFCILAYFNRTIGYSLLPLNWFILISLLNMPRVLYRIYQRRKLTHPAVQMNILIYGAGIGGLALSKWIKEGNNSSNLVGFLDDKPTLIRRRIDGKDVLGCERDIPTIHQVHQLHERWVTFQPDPMKRMRLKTVCDSLQIRLVIFPELEPFKRCIV